MIIIIADNIYDINFERNLKRSNLNSHLTSTRYAGEQRPTKNDGKSPIAFNGEGLIRQWVSKLLSMMIQFLRNQRSKC